MYNVLVPLLILYFLSGWTIYGYVLFYSDENNCREVPQTKEWVTVMIVGLVLGTITIIASVVFSIMVPYLIIQYLRRNNEQERS